MRRIAAVATLALIAGLAGCSGGAQSGESGETGATASSAPSELTGYGTLAVEADTVTNIQKDNTTLGGPCLIEDGYDDITESSTVTIKDASGTIVGTANLQSEGLKAAEGSDESMFSTYCGFRFLADHLPATSDFYTVSIAGRGEQTYTADELHNGVELTLGDVPGK